MAFVEGPRYKRMGRATSGAFGDTFVWPRRDTERNCIALLKRMSGKWIQWKDWMWILTVCDVITRLKHELPNSNLALVFG